jgi:gamma-glutamyltranspeptidase/glutathione hydrolase
MISGGRAVIATEHNLSAAAGARIYARGGNAIDAAVAAAFVEGVVNPHMHTLGGEAPMLVRPAGQRRVFALNGNTAAPARATLAEYRALGLTEIPGEGLLAAGVPAALDALITALAEFGTCTLAEVIEPALELCDEGFPLHVGITGARDAAVSVGGAPATLRDNAAKFLEQWPSSARVYLPNGQLPAPGTLLANPALARCFRRLLDAEAASRKQGRAAGLDAARERFYRGDIARQIAAWSQAHGGLLSPEDLARFRTLIEQPAQIEYHGVRVHKCGPWSQGPVFLQQLRLLESFDLRALGHNSADYIHAVVEAAKLAFADRNAYYGDPQFVDVPLAQLLSPEYAAVRRALIDPQHARRELARPGDPRTLRAEVGAADGRGWGRGTVHVDAADRAGNLIAITPSGAWIPSSPVIEELGFPLGTRLQTFELVPDHPNAPAPGKRPRTTLSPSLAQWDDSHGLAFGTMGGDNQDQWTLQFFLNRIHFGMSLQEAIEAPRFSTMHFASSFTPHTAVPGVVTLEDRIDAEVVQQLRDRGHVITSVASFSEGYVLAVEQDMERKILHAAADPRGQHQGVFPAYAIGW